MKGDDGGKGITGSASRQGQRRQRVGTSGEEKIGAQRKGERAWRETSTDDACPSDSGFVNGHHGRTEQREQGGEVSDRMRRLIAIISFCTTNQ